MLQLVSYKIGNFYKVKFFFLIIKTVAFGAVFSIKKVDREKLIKKSSKFSNQRS